MHIFASRPLPAGACGYGSHDIIVKNERQGSGIKFSELMPHLIKDHHFFKGNLYYRLDPLKAINVLELKPGVDYTPITKTENIWVFSGYLYTKRQRARAINSPDKKLNIAPGVELFIAGDECVFFAKRHFNLKRPFKINEEYVLMPTLVHEGYTSYKRIKNTYVIG